MKTGIRAFLILAAAVMPVMAQAVPSSFTARVDRNQVSAGEKLEVTLEFSGERTPSGLAFPAPELTPQLTLLRVSGPMTQQSIQIINGRVTRSASLTITYVYLARKAGEVTIPPFEHNYQGRLLSTDPITVTVLERPPPPDADARTGWQPPSDPYLELRLDKKELYVGEPVIAVWTLFYRAPIRELKFVQDPSMGNYLAAELSQATRLMPSSKMINGRIWQTAFLKSIAIYPLREGEVEVGSLTLGYLRDIFREDYISFDPEAILVKGLPEEGKPDDFSGAVGQFQVSVSRDQGRVEVGQSFEFTLKVEGSGHPDLIPDPRRNYDLPAGLDLYITGTERDIKPARDGILATRAFKISVAPRTPGEYQLPPFKLSYFDPLEEEYKTAASPPIRIIATTDREIYPRARPVSGPTAAPPTEPLFDIKPDRGRLSDQGGWLLASPAAVAVQVVPLLAVTSALLLRRRRERLEKDSALARRLKAGPKSKKALRQAEKLLAGNDPVNACDLAGRALACFIADLFARPEQGMTAADAAAALEAAGVSEDLVKRAAALLEQCDQVRFAPSALTEKDCARLFADLRGLLADLAREVKP